MFADVLKVMQEKYFVVNNGKINMLLLFLLLTYFSY